MKFNAKSFVYALVVCAFVILAKNIYSCKLSSQIDKGIYRVAKLGQVEGLYIGSSMFRQGIDIREAVRKSENIFMLAYNGLDPANEKLILEYLINSGLVIKNLYVDMYAYSASGEPWLAETRMLFDAPLSLKIAVWKLIMSNTQANFFTASYELFISSGNDMIIFWPLYKFLVSDRYYKGGAAKGSYSSGTTAEALRKNNVPDKGSSKMNDTQKKSVREIIKMCHENNINIIFIETPKFIDVVRSEIYKSIMTEYFELLKSEGVKFIMSQETLNALNLNNIHGYIFQHDDAYMFGDYVHLSGEGSRIFTRLLQDMI